MRNVFDQYNQPENQLTHALASALHADPLLVRPFLRRIAGVSERIPRNLVVTEQSLPGDPPMDDEVETTKKGLPDACIYNEEEGWILVIECKVSSGLTRDQLNRHLTTIASRGFIDIRLLTITVDHPTIKLPSNASSKRWSDIYTWLRSRPSSQWATNVAEFMETAEARWAGGAYLKEGTLTAFAGYPFGPERAVTYLEAKRVQGLAMTELRTMNALGKHLGADLEAPGRPSITGSKTDAVWDFIPLKSSGDAKTFTKFPHLTHGINDTCVQAMVTFPNSMRTDLRRNLIDPGEEQFVSVVLEVERNLRRALKGVPGAQPKFRALQRHYRSQKSIPTLDARLEFDLRTALPKKKGAKSSVVHPQDQWLRAAFAVFARKRSNYQIQIGADLPFTGGKSKLATAAATTVIADTWIACKPLLWAALGK